MYHCYAFEARSIQPWLMAGGRMADMVAASAIVDQLCNTPLDDVLARLGVGKRVRFVRRAGGVFIVIAEERETLMLLRDAWSLQLPLLAPGLEAIHALAEGESEYAAVAAARPLLGAARNRPALTLPVAGPLVEREARTGQPAVARIVKGSARKQGFVGAATVRKRSPQVGALSGLSDKLFDADWLAQRRASGEPELVWPLDLEQQADDEADEPGTASEFAFPFEGIDQIGVIHADGNGLGKVLIGLDAHFRAQPQGYADAFRAFSDGLEAATLAAARQATVEVLVPAAVSGRGRRGRTVMRLPARPLVLGGDDLTMIVRADLAWAFTRAFVEAFEKESARFIAQWSADFMPAGKGATAGPRMLTASAGVVFVRPSQPFQMAYELCEELCKFAKNRTEKLADPASGVKPGAIAFARVTKSIDSEAGNPFATTVTLDEGKPARMSLGAYTFSGRSDMPEAGALEALARVLSAPEMSRGPARNLLNLFELDARAARQGYARWREIMQRRLPAHYAAFVAAMASFGEVHPELPMVMGEWEPKDGTTVEWATPLADVQRLLNVSTQLATEWTNESTTGRAAEVTA